MYLYIHVSPVNLSFYTPTYMSSLCIYLFIIHLSTNLSMYILHTFIFISKSIAHIRSYKLVQDNLREKSLRIDLSFFLSAATRFNA